MFPMNPFQKLRRVSLCLAALAILSASSLLAQTGNKPLVGTWNLVATTPDGDKVPFGLIIKEQDGKLTGTLKFDTDEGEAKDFSVADGVIKFQAPYQGNFYDIEMKLVEGKLTGKWHGTDSEGEISGTKAEA
jgi:hypothetical protein